MFTEILRQLRPTLVIFLAMTLLTGAVYPLAVSAVAGTLFPAPATGNLIVKDGKVIGSRLIGQPFQSDKYFFGRPSATIPAYNAASSSGSNLGPTNPAFIDAVKQRASGLRAKHPAQKGDVPIDLVTASGSGLDPHISPAAAYYQVDRVAAVRGLTAERVRRLVDQNVEPRTLGILGEPRVNVLLLNLALDQISP
jgi:potassium-transporting ATPase KdpC subunit